MKKMERSFIIQIEALEAGSEVTGKIDWDRRFDLMQQHSGEHIVSGLVHEAYGYDNVGFHMGSDTITVDLNGPLDETQLAEIEAEKQMKIWENSEVKILYPTAEELEKIDYRSKKELTGQVRIVDVSRGGYLCMLWNSCDAYRRNRNAEASFSRKIP